MSEALLRGFGLPPAIILGLAMAVFLAAASCIRVVAGGEAPEVGPHGAPSGVVVQRDPGVRSGLVQLEVQGDPQRHRPVAVDHLTVEVDADHVLGS